ncbi:Ig-like domain-containing protein [bacterium]|nr:Ig-like domain-containing protein [bacterium]
MKMFKISPMVFFGLLWVVGCHDNDDMMQTLKISPNDGETNVALNKNIELDFDTPMARSVVQRNFHMMTTQKMQTIADSMMVYMVMMGMMTHGDSATIYDGMMRMMDNNTMRGTFVWNSDSTRCTFDPDSLMMPGTQYRMHMGREMMTMTGMMQGNGMMSGDNHEMMGNAGGMMHGDRMTYFTTGNSMMKSGNLNN